MINTQLITNSESIPKKSKKSSNKNSRSSIKLSGDSVVRKSNTSVKKKFKSKKTRRSLRNSNVNEESDSLSSERESDSSEPTKVQPKKKITKRIVRRRRTVPVATSRATMGREYGNTVSKQNVLKASERAQSLNKLSEHTSSKTASREYGDFYSWQTGISHLETHRIDIINSKGIKNFTDEYNRKLQKCQEFESAHRVTPFAAVRLEMLNRACDGNSSKTDVFDESPKNLEVDRDVDNNYENPGNNVGEISVVNNDTKADTKNLSVSTLKTIELIRKYKSGQSIKADLHVSKKSESSMKNDSKQRATRLGSKDKKNRSSSMKKEKPSEKQSDKSDKEKNVVANTGKTESTEKMTTVALATKKTDEDQEENSSEKSVKLAFGNIGQNSMNSMNYLKLSERKENVSEKSDSSNSQSGYVVTKKIVMSSENSITVLEGRKRYDTSSRGIERHLESNFSGRKLPLTTQRASISQEKNLNSIETLYRNEGVLQTPKLNDKRIGSVATRRSE